jgi:hypothetical protein
MFLLKTTVKEDMLDHFQDIETPNKCGILLKGYSPRKTILDCNFSKTSCYRLHKKTSQSHCTFKKLKHFVETSRIRPTLKNWRLKNEADHNPWNFRCLSLLFKVDQLHLPSQNLRIYCLGKNHLSNRCCPPPQYQSKKTKLCLLSKGNEDTKQTITNIEGTHGIDQAQAIRETRRKKITNMRMVMTGRTLIVTNMEKISRSSVIIVVREAILQRIVDL